MALVSDILYGAMRLNRVRNTNDTTRANEALKAFNNMLKSWERLLITPTKEDLTLTAATSEYTIGSGGDFDTARPMRIISAYIRDDAGIDYEVDVMMSPKDFDRVSDKDAEGRPTQLYYDNLYSSGLGKIYFNSAPDAAETFQLTSIKGESTYSAITDTITQPPEYEEAMIYNLAVRLAPEYGFKLEQQVFILAERLRAKLEARNYRTPGANFDIALLRT